MLRPIFRPILGTMARALTQGGLRSRYLGPSLDLNFAADTYLRGAIDQVPTPQAFGSVITFTRASGGGRINSLGQFEWVGNDVPRLTYDPITLQPLGIWIEEQRTNLLLNSVLAGGMSGTVGAGAVAPTNWVFGFEATGGNITFGLAPWGTVSFLTSKSITTNRPFLQRSFAADANTAYTLSARVVSASGALQIFDVIEIANRPAGSTVTYRVNGNTFANTDFVTLSPWDLISCTVQVGATAGTLLQRAGVGSAGSGATTGSISLTMPQFEVGLTPSSYIPTEASQVTRAADVCSVNTLSPWFNAVEGTLVAEFVRSAIEQGTRIATLSGTFGNFIRLEGGFASPANAQMIVSTGGTTQAVVVGGVSVAGVRQKIAASYASNSFSASLNGSASSTDLSGTVPAVSALEIGRHVLDGTRSLGGTISRITYYPRVIDVQQASA